MDVPVWCSAATRRAGLEAPGHITDDAVEKCPKTGDLVGAGLLERAARTETLDKELLHGIFEFLRQRRAAPARGQVGADDRLIAPRQLFALGRAASCRGLDHRPAS